MISEGTLKELEANLQYASPDLKKLLARHRRKGDHSPIVGLCCPYCGMKCCIEVTGFAGHQVEMYCRNCEQFFCF